ncbi:hypothetical protein DES53_104193 [Roseimicrobium gellanilyticum]|uniref:Uncharacterized protein n=1 Tax=Roseimicrobium gellanilyticum TaxID=748857 RepID=A0A366HMZ1_9BACT|nr:hypothetical protein [Roseimicrobium gellanilyticum]RBP44373.1 hypothetical protein DES53_104193 [Roseimicrobium gellanilyticum]
MSAESLPLTPPSKDGTNLWPLIWKFIKISPLTTLAIYTLVSLQLEENYPISNYPMYSNPSPERPYYMVTDGEGKPVAIQTLTGVTCPKIGKIYRTKSEKLAKELDVKAVDLKPEHQQTIAMEMFAYLRDEAKQKGQTAALPAKLRLVKNYLTYENREVVETPTLIGQE